MRDQKVYGLLGIGAGPMNLAMAVAWLEQARCARTDSEDAVFLDNKPEFSWHPGMQVDGARMQTSFLKDLVTQQDPTSKFTFLNYLHGCGRLDDFINLRELYPSRLEFEGYFRWAASQLGDRVRFGWTVDQVRPAMVSGFERPLFAVRARHATQGTMEWHAINLSLAMGLAPRLPFEVTPGDSRIVHSSRYKLAMDETFADHDHPWDFLLVGAGQSSAELLVDLAQRYPNARITVASRGLVYRAADASPFVNDMFNDDASVAFSHLPAGAREHVLQDLRNSNYAAADEPLVQQIRSMIYDERVRGTNRVRVRSYTEVKHAMTADGDVEVELRDVLTGNAHCQRFSGVVCATGFSGAPAREMLATLSETFKAPDAALRVDSDYRLLGLDAYEGGIYVQGYTDSLVDTTIISNLGRRAHRLVSRMCDAPAYS